MSGPKCNLPEDRHREILGRFPAFLSQEEEDEIRDMFPQYLFFRNEFEDDGFHVSTVPTRICTCTACGESFAAVRGNWAKGKLHHEMCNCPSCGRQVEGIAVGKYKYDMSSLASWVKTAVARVTEDGALLIEAGEALRRFNHDELVGEIVWSPEKRYYFKRGTESIPQSAAPASFVRRTLPARRDAPIRHGGQGERTPQAAGGGKSRGTVQMWSRRLTEWHCDGSHSYTWKANKNVSDAFAPNFFADYNGDYILVGLRGVLEHGDWKYCQMEAFYHFQYGADVAEETPSTAEAVPPPPDAASRWGGDRGARWMVLYLAWYALHPQIEMAVKLGFSDAVEDLIERGKKNARLLNWDADNPAGFLRMSRRDARAFVRAAMSFRDLKTWRETDKGSSFADYIALADLVGGAENLRKVSERARAHGIALKTAARYIAKLLPACQQYAPRTEVIIQTWCDYLDMAKSLNYDLTEETVLMPKNLQERHDTAAETLGELDRLDEIKAYKIRRRQLEKKYAFKMDGLCILVPDSAEEIIAEGKTLHHCVGGYAARHMQGKTIILFLRKARTPMRSFLTIELTKRQGRTAIMQIHGYRNEGYAKSGKERDTVNPRERYAWFLNTWLDWVNAGSKRDRQGNPVLPEGSKTEKKERTA